MIVKKYSELKNEYDKGIRELGSMSSHEREYTAKGIKLIKRIKQVRAEMDKIRTENPGKNWLQ